jgi:3-oxoacyl-[acyl-carrier-protein] synthase-1
MDKPVFICGIGIISAIGLNAAECMDAVEHLQSGICATSVLPTRYQSTLPTGEVKLSNEALSTLSGLSPATSRTAQLSMIAAAESLADADIAGLSALRTGFISATSVGGMDKSEVFFKDFLRNPGKGRLKQVVHHDCGSVTNLVADQLGIRDFVSTVSTACSSSANAIFLGARMIKSNRLDVVVAGGTDALSKFTLNGFNTLMILDGDLCKPFDENRKGLNLGEGAGYIVMVSEKVAKMLKRKPYCTLSGYHNANDAFHQTASSANGLGAGLAMEGAIKKSGLQPGNIDYINLHGTGTQNNDVAEGTAIERIFYPHFPGMSSTKAFTGHTLAASAGIEAVLSVMAIKNDIIYPNLRWSTPMKELSFVPEVSPIRNAGVNHVLSNSFGFGGNCSSLIFSRV